ncbi:MAG: HAD-IC family P-type ATPase [Candidatus Bathyarchaeia archaeon]
MAENHEHKEHGEGSVWGLVFSGAALGVGLALSFLSGRSLVSDLVLLAAMLVSGYSIAVSGLKALLRGRVSIDLLITVAAVGASLIGHLEEGAAVVLLFNLAERLEDYAGERARHAIEELMELRPEVAVVRRGGAEVEVPVGEVMPGEVFVLRPGDRVPLDGEVIEGESGVDQSAITGESVPAAKGVGGDVYAGTMNVDGFLAVRATSMAEESTLARILHMVEEAEESKSPTEAFVDRFSRWYTPAVIGAAVVVAVVPPLLLGQPLMDWVYRALVMLVVACPCALAISTPVAMVSAIASASRNGVLVKGSIHVEELARAEARPTRSALSILNPVAPLMRATPRATVAAPANVARSGLSEMMAMERRVVMTGLLPMRALVLATPSPLMATKLRSLATPRLRTPPRAK